MDDKKALLRHFLAALAYRTQKALRGSSEAFPSFRAAPGVRTPHELLHHMDSVLGYAQTFFAGGSYRVPPLPDLQAEVARFHSTLSELARLVLEATDWSRISPEQLLQGPLSDAMTHAGQLALLRRLSGDPVPPENFVFAAVTPSNLGATQPLPVAPDTDWPERPGSAPGARTEDPGTRQTPAVGRLASDPQAPGATTAGVTATVFVGTSLDGFLARPNGDLDFLPPGGGEEHGYGEFLASVDALVIGRNTFETVLRLGEWPYGRKPVVVLSTRPLDSPPPPGAVVERMEGSPVDVVARLAARGARHLYVDGGVTIQRFLEAGRIQRLVVTRVPVLIGSGIPLFGALARDVELGHVATRVYASGLVQSEYVVA